MAEKYPVPFGRCVALRSYRWHPKKGRARKVVVEIGTPVAVPGSDWGVRLRITGLRKPLNRRVFGIDSIQALELALMLSGSLIVDSREFKAGEIELWERRVKAPFELALPLPLNSLQGALQTQSALLERLTLRGRGEKEWQHGLLAAMREVSEHLATLR